jgi:DNA-binding NarL/FixJ family response regulator
MNFHYTHRVLIVDDEHIVRDALVRALKSMTGFKVVGLAANGLEAIEQHKRLLPDIVLMDAKMPRIDGITATRHIRRVEAHSCIIALMTYGDDPTLRAAMLEAGASLCLSKHDGLEALELALHTVTASVS